MLNRVILMGRITHNLEVRQTPNGTSALTFTVAVDRNFKNAAGEYEADFITCVAWRNTAEFIGRYFGKGRLIALEGQLRSRTYEDKNGTKHYVTEVYVDSASFTGEKNAQSTPQNGFDSGSSNLSGNSYGGSQNGSAFTTGQSSGGFIAGTEQPPSAKNSTVPADFDMSGFEDVLSDDGVPF